ncbi:hypothetical protein ACFPT7_12200 [Acidicapsa dinghuensis]|uniref:Uncharacterized protein n=1 Tax=Acidicapsa dinghuensis TaxID=2218256 RepID=A0ABW1EG40_9BACT|nr:hypothetical protein [Acidicapsa dinghuensis]
MIVDFLNLFEPDPEGLLRQISEHVNDEVLKWISMADYGEEADEHLAALRQVRDTGTFPREMHWCPAEVMELIRWSDPEDPDWKPGQTGELGHWMRAFSCAALLRATREPWNYGDGLGTDSTVAQMALSLDALPVDFSAQAAKFLAWLLLHSEPEGSDGQVCAYGLGLFWFALKHPAQFTDGSLISLAEWVSLRADELYQSPASELRQADAISDNRTSAPGDGLREMALHCQKRSSWELLAIKLLDLDLSTRSYDLQARVQMIGEGLLG